MSDTPRTDAEKYKCHVDDKDWCVEADFARTLERELADSRTENENLRRQMTRIAEGRHAASAKGFARQVMWDWPRRKDGE